MCFDFEKKEKKKKQSSMLLGDKEMTICLENQESGSQRNEGLKPRPRDTQRPDRLFSSSSLTEKPLPSAKYRCNGASFPRSETKSCVKHYIRSDY